MATRNGARFLDAQLASISRQTHPHWSLRVSDDGSTDGTRAIVERFAAAHPPGRVSLIEGPGRGSTANFLSLIADTGTRGGLFATADQDDVWLPGKLARAVRILEPGATAPCARPMLYGGRTIVTDASLRPRALSPLFTRPPAFANALVQSYSGGNTMVFNAALRDLVRAAGGSDAGPVCHDWWLYLLATGAGGSALYDPRPQVLYRQHGANLVGANVTFAARLSRLAGILSGRFARWNAANAGALLRARHLLTPEARGQLAAFRAARATPGPLGLARLRAARVYRQTRAGDASLALAAFLGRV
jgi:glycosyltransferase involved in cell wall biosynthesis